MQTAIVHVTIVCSDGMCELAGMSRCVCSAGYAVYTVEVHPDQDDAHGLAGGHSWRVHRRYSEFRALHLALTTKGTVQDAFARALAGQLPPRLGTAFSTLPPVVTSRRRALGRYLERAVAVARREQYVPCALERFLRDEHRDDVIMSTTAACECRLTREPQCYE